MTTRAGWISRLTVSLTLTLTALGATAQETIKIGEINSYKAQPAFLGPDKNGWNLALDEVNASGGVLRCGESSLLYLPSGEGSL